MKKYVIFDLDLTLVDTTLAEPYRSKRDWNGAFSVIPQCTVYEGLNEIFDVIRKFGINTCIVSTSPRPYVERIVSHYQIPARFIVGYHDAHPIKPHPAPMLKALELMNEKAEDVLSFGDRAIDMIAAKKAGIKAIACLWGTKEKSMLLGTAYDQAISSPLEILPYLE